ncbi:MAG: hypothetical protein H5T69_16250 [Chloroflexi bacterium]|nr:hypothetical protein [Chloroflexota bacterium]
MADLIVAGLTVREDDRGRLHFWGEVFNLSEVAKRWVRVTIRLLGEDDMPLMEGMDITALEWTLPGGRNAFHIRFQDPPQGWKSYEITVTGQDHDWNDFSVPQPAPGLLVDRVHYREIGRADLYCGLIGMLSNTGLVPATHVKVAGTLYGPDGSVVGLVSPYLVPRGVFRPGDAMAFELKFYAVGGIVANYQVQTQGRRQASNF